MNLEETMDLPAVAAFLGAKAETVAQLTRNGELPGAQMGKGWIFLREDVLIFLRERIAMETGARRAGKAQRGGMSLRGAGHEMEIGGSGGSENMGESRWQVCDNLIQHARAVVPSPEWK